MTSIATLHRDMKTASRLNKAGQIIDAARIALSVQQQAPRCRSRFASALAMDAHCFAATVRVRLDNAGITDHAALSEAGRIAKASAFFLHG